jgi:cell division GTPase FtsZ
LLLGVEELEKVVDVLIVVSNQKLLKYEKTLTYVRSFEIVDETIYKCIEVTLQQKRIIYRFDWRMNKIIEYSTIRTILFSENEKCVSRV